MNKKITVRNSDAFSLVEEMDVYLRDDSITFSPQGGGPFLLSSVEDAKKIKNLLDLWIKYQELESED